MNREIKFRGLTISEQHWVYGSPRFFKSGRVEIFDLDETFYVKPETVCQFTGIKDKNGTELFEGDICKVAEWYLSDYKEVEFIGEIMYEDGSFFVYRKVEKYPLYQELDSCSVSNRNIVKIGNKFENEEWESKFKTTTKVFTQDDVKSFADGFFDTVKEEISEEKFKSFEKWMKSKRGELKEITNEFEESFKRISNELESISVIKNLSKNAEKEKENFKNWVNKNINKL